MGRNYKQFSLEERCEIARLRADGQSLRQIATSLGRAASSISREIKRNSGVQVGYKPTYADDLAWGRRWQGSRLVRQPALYQLVMSKLVMGWSPEQVSGWSRFIFIAKLDGKTAQSTVDQLKTWLAPLPPSLRR